MQNTRKSAAQRGVQDQCHVALRVPSMLLGMPCADSLRSVSAGQGHLLTVNDYFAASRGQRRGDHASDAIITAQLDIRYVIGALVSCSCVGIQARIAVRNCQTYRLCELKQDVETWSAVVNAITERSQSPKDMYLEQVLIDEAEGLHCPRCGEWHSPDGTAPEDFCHRLD